MGSLTNDDVGSKRFLQSEFTVFQNSPVSIFHVVQFIKCCVDVLSSGPPQNHWNKPVSRRGRTISYNDYKGMYKKVVLPI